jgi:hypothetical protein
MSGRGKGRGGRGRFQARNPPEPSTRPDKESKKSIKDWNYYIGSAKQATEYEAITEYLINLIKGTFECGNDIAMAIVNQEPVITSSWRPSLKKSSDPDQDIKDTENRQYEMEFSSDFNRYRKREEVYENNIVKSYALFWEKCTVGMKNKIQGRTDFKSKIENNPFELLNSIKEHSMNYQENQYEYSIILDSMITLLTTKQKEGENLQDYTKRFRISKELCESHIGGPIVLFKTLVDNKAYKVEATDQMEHEKNRKLQEQAFEQLLAYTYLKHADQSKYGSIIEGLVTQKSLKNDQYPKTITEANNVLSNHRFDTPKISSRFQQSKGSSDIGRREPEAEKINLSFAHSPRQHNSYDLFRL